MQHTSFHHSLIALMMLCLPAATPATAQVQEMEVNIFEMMKQTDKAVVVTVHTLQTFQQYDKAGLPQLRTQGGMDIERDDKCLRRYEGFYTPYA